MNADVKTSKTSHLKKLAELFESGEHKAFIQMHNSPDPDSIASAYGLQYLLKHEGVEPVICYRGEIEKYSTNRMVELLDIRLKNILDTQDMKETDFIVLVDSQKGNSNVTDFIGNEIASIDHHPVFYEVQYLFEDIRPKVGACSSIIAEYFYENAVDMPQTIATALLYGIKTDTLDLSRGVSELDLEMFYRLYKTADIGLLNQIQLNKLQYCELTAYSNAINNIRLYDNVAFAYLGVDCPDSLIGTISDFIMSLKEVELSIVYSKRESGVKFSVRNETPGYDAGRIIMKALDGLGSGGGHKTMAGGFIPAAAIEELGQTLHSFIENRVMDVIHAEFSSTE
ncbi:MAG: DHH family phosphoesterase [Thermoclostridium sp.]|nr:DHH family phosphoesterase [Thermoclostridium sp.]